MAEQGLGSMVLQASNGDIILTKEAQDLMTLDAARRATTRNVPDYPLWHQSDLPDGVVSDKTVGYQQVGWQALRVFREQSPLIKSIHASRHRKAREAAQIWDGKPDSVGIQVVHESQLHGDREPPTGFDKFIRRAERLLDCPAPGQGFNTLDSLVVPLVEDLLTINRPALEVLTSTSDEDVVVGIRPVDGALLMERANYVRGWLNANAGDANVVARRARDYLDRGDGGTDLVSEQVGKELTGEEYVLVRNGIVEGTYSPGRIYINPLRTRTDIQFTPYQPSAVEDALEAIAAFWETWDRENKVFREGFWTDTLLFFSEIDTGDFLNLVQQFREAGQGYHRSRKPMMVRGIEGSKVQSIPIKEPPSEMQFQQRFIMTAMLVLGIYQEHPSSVYFPEWQGGARSALAEHDKSDEINNARASGHKVDIRQICGQLTRVVKEKIHPELVVVYRSGEYNAMEEAKLHDLLVKTSTTRNDIRVAQQKIPYGFYLTAEELKTASEEDKKKWAENPWNQPDSDTFLKASQPKEPGPGGAPGQPPGGGDKPAQATKPKDDNIKPAKDMSKGLYVPMNVDDWQTYR